MPASKIGFLKAFPFPTLNPDFIIKKPADIFVSAGLFFPEAELYGRKLSGTKITEEEGISSVFSKIY